MSEAVQPPENDLDAALAGAEDAALRERMRKEVDRLSPAARETLVKQLRELADYRRREGKRQLDSVPPRPAETPPAVKRKQSSRVRVLLVLAGAALLLIGFIAFCYGMAFGVPHQGISHHGVSHHGAPSSGASLAWLVTRVAWSLLLTGMLIRDMQRVELAAAWDMARRVTLTVIALNVLVIALIVGVAYLLDSIFPWLDRSWIYLLPGFQGHALNIGLIPTQFRYFGIAFLLLFAVRVPSLARGEEMSFRRGTVGWRDGSVRSIRFGLAHCLAGVPIYAGLALAIGGLWFTYQYFRGGVERSTLHHATYNWIVLSACLVAAVLYTFH